MRRHAGGHRADQPNDGESVSPAILAVNPTERWWYGEWVGRPANREAIYTAAREHVILTVAAAEVAVGLAIIVALFRRRQTVQVEELNALKN